MDNFTFSPNSSPPSGQGEVVHHVRIGLTLAICEAATLRVGIPLLPPTARVWNLRSHMEGTLEYFLRLNLIEIPTTSLLSYHEELLAGSTLAQDLQIPVPSTFERFYSVIWIVAAALSLSLLFSALLALSPGSAAVSAVVCIGAGGLIGASLVSDEHRRLSFAWVLYREILRRKGIDPSGQGNLQVCPS